MNTLLPARPRLSKSVSSVWFTLYGAYSLLQRRSVLLHGRGSYRDEHFIHYFRFMIFNFVHLSRFRLKMRC